MPHTAAKALVIFLFIYSCIFSSVLVIGAISRGFSTGNVVTAVLLLPVVYYFASEIRWQMWFTTRGFRMSAYLLQKNALFAVTILLLIVAALLTYLRSRGMTV